MSNFMRSAEHIIIYLDLEKEFDKFKTYEDALNKREPVDVNGIACYVVGCRIQSGVAIKDNFGVFEIVGIDGMTGTVELVPVNGLLAA